MYSFPKDNSVLTPNMFSMWKLRKYVGRFSIGLVQYGFIFGWLIVVYATELHAQHTLSPLLPSSFTKTSATAGKTVGNATAKASVSGVPTADPDAEELSLVPRGVELKRFSFADVGPVVAAVISPDGKYLLTGSDKIAWLWDATRAEDIGTFEGHEGLVLCVAFSPDGTQVLTGSADGTACLWETETSKLVQTFGERGSNFSITSVDFSPDGKKIVTASDDKTVCIWDVLTGKKLFMLEGHTDWVFVARFSPDGKTVATGSQDATIRLWNVETGKELHVFKRYIHPVYSIAFSPDGKFLVSGGESGIIRLWNLETGRGVSRFRGCRMAVRSVAFSPDGKQILSGCEDGTARLWNVETGEEVRRFRGYPFDMDSVNAVGFLSTGTAFFTGSGDGIARFWQ